MRSARVIKPLIGIMLIVVAVMSLLLWEVKGRDAIFLETVVVAKEDIKAGTKISEDVLLEVGIPRENKVRGAIKPEEVQWLQGKVTNQLILKNSQLSDAYFQKNDFYLNEGQSIFVINSKWISMRSSSLRRGDWVDIYNTKDGVHKIGTFKTAYVKDKAEREVKSINESTGERIANSNVFEREDSSAAIDHIEIICSIDQYDEVAQIASLQPEPSLIIVQKGKGK